MNTPFDTFRTQALGEGFDEVIEPTFNQPLSLATKELAAKQTELSGIEEELSKAQFRRDLVELRAAAVGHPDESRTIAPGGILATAAGVIASEAPLETLANGALAVAIVLAFAQHAA